MDCGGGGYGNRELRPARLSVIPATVLSEPRQVGYQPSSRALRPLQRLTLTNNFTCAFYNHFSGVKKSGPLDKTSKTQTRRNLIGSQR